MLLGNQFPFHSPHRKEPIRLTNQLLYTVVPKDIHQQLPTLG
jgi:hypothetical protein